MNINTDDVPSNELITQIIHAITTRDEELKQKNISQGYPIDVSAVTENDWIVIHKALNDARHPLIGKKMDLGITLRAEMEQESLAKKHKQDFV